MLLFFVAFLFFPLEILFLWSTVVGGRQCNRAQWLLLLKPTRYHVIQLYPFWLTQITALRLRNACYNQLKCDRELIFQWFLWCVCVHVFFSFMKWNPNIKLRTHFAFKPLSEKLFHHSVEEAQEVRCPQTWKIQTSVFILKVWETSEIATSPHVLLLKAVFMGNK